MSSSLYLSIGSSAINGMIYVRGDKDDYDYWERLGNTGWSYKDIFHYFKKSMDQQDIKKLTQRPDLYSNSGPLVVETPSFRVPLAEAFLKAATEQGSCAYYIWNDFDFKECSKCVPYTEERIRNGIRTETVLEGERKRNDFRFIFQIF